VKIIEKIKILKTLIKQIFINNSQLISVRVFLEGYHPLLHRFELYLRITFFKSSKFKMKFNIQLMCWIILLNSLDLKYTNGYKCEFVVEESKYTCNLKLDEDIKKEKHLPGKNDANVVQYFINGAGNGVIDIKEWEQVLKRFRNVQSCYVLGIKIFRGNIFQHWKHLKILDFRLTPVKEIPESFFDQNTKLTSLTILWNKNLTTLPENIFKNQKDLVNLNLNYNKINFLPSNIFKTLKNLDTLDLGGNKLGKLDSIWFKELQKLTTLGLCCNGISEISEDVFKPLIKLQTLILSLNFLTVLNSNSFGNHNDLTYISVGSNKIDAIDEKIIDNTAVNEFNMDRNICSQNKIKKRDEIKETLKECFTNYLK